MTVTAPPLPGGAATNTRTRGVRTDRTFSAVALTSGLLVLAILALIAYATAKNAWPAFRHQGLSFVYSRNWDPNVDHFGAFDFIYGTIVAATIALIISVPFSLGIALYASEIASKRMRKLITYVVDLLAAIPSVVYGFWALAVFQSPAMDFYGHVADTIGSVPVFGAFFGGPVTGKSFMTAGIILAVMITPIITSLSREALVTVPQEDKNAALAMGATRWETIRVSVLPRVRSGIIGAVMLGLGRALGETIAVALVIGANHQTTLHLFQSGDSMASTIAHNFGEATGVYRSALIGLGVVLFAITIVVNMVARGIANRTPSMIASGE